MTFTQPQSTLEQLRQLRQSIPPAVDDNKTLREEMLAEARQLLLDLERPDNAVERVCYQYMETSAISIGIRLGLFEYLNLSEPSTSAEVAQACNGDPLLVGRILRCLASYGAVKQHGADSYGATTVSFTFAQRANKAAMSLCFDVLSRGWHALPEFLEEHGWQNSTSHTDTAIAKGWGRSSGSAFEVLLDRGPAATEAFNVYMGTFNEGRKDWTDFYPIHESLIADADKDPASVFMVDVGGGHGHQTINLKRKFPQLPGRLIVQEIPQGMPSLAVDESSGIEFMGHDFFAKQPVQGARCYYLRYIVHDYSQEMSTKLCLKLKEAMKPGYSKLLIHEWIVPEVGASRLMTAQDLNLMAISGGMERTLALHSEFLEKAGLTITKVHRPGDDLSESVIEVMLCE